MSLDPEVLAKLKARMDELNAMPRAPQAAPENPKKSRTDEPLIARIRDSLHYVDIARRDGVNHITLGKLIAEGLVPGAFQGHNRRWMVPKDVDVRAIVEAHCRVKPASPRSP